MVVLTGLGTSLYFALRSDPADPFSECRTTAVAGGSAAIGGPFELTDHTGLRVTDVDVIDGIVPAIAIEQRVASKNSRSTVGTTTEIYDYLRLLFARIGRTYSPKSGKEVTKTEVSDVVDFIHKFEKSSRIGSKSLTYVAGFDRGVRPIGD